MNVFYLDKNPETIASMMTDKHIVKMVLETGQLLSTVHRILEGDRADPKFYKKTHENHPCAVWARSSVGNYLFLVELLRELSDEYTRRYGREHKTWLTLKDILKQPERLPNLGLTSIPQAMPVEYRDEDPVVAYRKYYVNEKLKTDRDIERYNHILGKIHYDIQGGALC